MSLADQKVAPAAPRPSWDALVAHQLKTPLCVLDAQLAETSSVDRKSLRQDIRKITKLIDQLQIFAECRDKPAVECTLHPLADLVRAVCTELAPMIFQKEQKLVFRDYSGGKSALMNVDLSHEAICNVIENAIKYTPEKGAIEVVVTARGAMYVMDRGIGISDKDKPHIYDAFRRGTAAMSISGTGLGLFLVKEVMMKQGGEISHRNRKGGGSVFVLQFHQGDKETA